MPELIFLFAYFLGNGEDGLRIAQSTDGYHWEDIEDRFLLSPDEGLMRDPFLYLGPDDTFHLIWTTNWKSQDIGYASSRDLRNWSHPKKIPVMESVPGTRNCWAPEMIYDPQAENYLIYWSSTVEGFLPDSKGSSESGYNHRIWSVRTKDFQQFSAPKVFFDPGFNVIDATLLQTEDRGYRLIAKDERLTPPHKNLFTCQAKSLETPFSIPSSPFTKSWVEGPSVLSIGEWSYVYYDVYKEKRYEGKRTKDFKQWEEISDSLSFPKGARHGSIVTIPSNRLSITRKNP